jgi:hypothetical protein
MINLRKLLILISIMSVSFGSVAAPVSMPWSVIAGPITSTVALDQTVSTASATLFDSSNAVLATGSISDFKLSPLGSIIAGLFTSDAGTYTFSGSIASIQVFNAVGGFVVSGFTGDSGDVDYGSISVTPGSSSLNLSGDTLDFTPVPVPAAVWLFGSALVSLVGVRRSKTSA